WIAAHSNVAGNEHADREAHSAASGAASPVTHLPQLLRRQLPLNSVLIKEQMATTLQEEWEAKWQMSPRKGRMDSNATRPLPSPMQPPVPDPFKPLAAQGVPQSLTHYLFKCPSYNYKRHSLDTKLGHNSRDLRLILSNKDTTSELLRYIGQKRQLQPSLGDVSIFRIVIGDQQNG
ncbi:hypothetical protein BYT27DRAFT_7197650, partial [Phlegmacium glaucopus]